MLEEKNLIIEEKNRDITDSIEFARTIQEAMLPSVDAITTNFEQSFVMFRPKDIVSGDFYWSQKHSKGDYVAAVDCIGHGVPGAMVSMLGNDLLNQSMNVGSCVHPGEFLTLLNQGVISNFKKDGKASVHNGMDMALCRFTPSGSLEFAGAKNPILIIRDGKLMEYKADRFSIGGITPEDHVFKTQKIKLEEGDLIYLFSDGFSDQFGGPRGKKFNIKNFKQLLLDTRDATMEQQKDILEESLDSWKGEIEQIDDVCIIGIRV
ncbi:MAG: serine/threonine-protein phosphatase [Flavobacteriales bacterium]|nr:serine/threonine-protein phosphatase [Flavobacteriales bacterium]